MAHHARIEELSDSASSDSDPPEDDLSAYASPSSPAGVPASHFAERYVQPALSSRTTSAQRGALTAAELGAYDTPAPSYPSQPAQSPPPLPPSEDSSRYQTIYPVYFDGSRTRSQGRRVGRADAVLNPLARELADAVHGLGLKTVFEPAKTHPRDWANPGRVRVRLKGGSVQNKHHLYKLISTYLKAHPTTASTPLRLRIQGVPLPAGPLLPPAVPRGWKMGSVLPLHSPALSGGGVSENILKDVMQEMQGAAGGMGAMQAMDGEGPGGKRRGVGRGR